MIPDGRHELEEEAEALTASNDRLKAELKAAKAMAKLPSSSASSAELPLKAATSVEASKLASKPASSVPKKVVPTLPTKALVPLPTGKEQVSPRVVLRSPRLATAKAAGVKVPGVKVPGAKVPGAKADKLVAVATSDRGATNKRMPVATLPKKGEKAFDGIAAAQKPAVRSGLFKN